MVWLAAAWLGMMLAERFSRREKEIERLLALFKRMEIEISHYSLSFPDFIEKAEKEASFQKLRFVSLCAERIKSGADFPVAWKKSVEDKPPILLCEERKRLSEMGAILSSCNKDGVLKVLSFYGEIFKNSLNEAKSAKNKYAKLCTVCGVFVGGVIFMILI